MANNHSLRGKLRHLLGLPSTLEITQSEILQAQQRSGDRIGNWRCACGHLNTIMYLDDRHTHPLGLLQCRACPLIWHPSITPKFTSRRLHINTHVLDSHAARSSHIVSQLRNPALDHVYICLGYGCGLTWRTDIKTKWLSWDKKKIMLVGGKRGKLHCDCGERIFEPGRYEVFETTPARMPASALLGVPVGEGKKRRGRG
ncbi:hypothetical protein yc1106_06971 [Curvularia clavata]|uniref:Probable double zinc ribbon domain-containing protein n=1 Tax=Curvularia clavata TaxID=95742 RepID=A0A9Q8ZCS6_CURCL|nr:hypothetical protein yc1106_06971 [Curvularia clavata]